jgi:hypothetical protein
LERERASEINPQNIMAILPLSEEFIKRAVERGQNKTECLEILSL